MGKFSWIEFSLLHNHYIIRIVSIFTRCLLTVTMVFKKTREDEKGIFDALKELVGTECQSRGVRKP